MTDEVLEVEVEAVETPVKTRKPRTVTPQKNTVRIVLEENEDIPPTGLFLGHNGRGFLLQPGQPVDIPRELLGILDNAVMSQPQLDPTTKTIVGYRDRLRYPYRRLDSGT